MVRDWYSPRVAKQFKRYTADGLGDEILTLIAQIKGQFERNAVKAVNEVMNLHRLEVDRHTKQWITNVRDTFGVDVSSYVSRRDVSDLLELTYAETYSLMVEKYSQDIAEQVRVATFNAIKNSGTAVEMAKNLNEELKGEIYAIAHQRSEAQGREFIYKKNAKGELIQVAAPSTKKSKRQRAKEFNALRKKIIKPHMTGAELKVAQEKFAREIELEGQRYERIVENGKARVVRAGTIPVIRSKFQSRVDLIARDQTAKLTGALNKFRQQEAGIDEYIWLTAGDERVRATHAANSGQTFSWDRPPTATGHPGHDINCRCTALGVV